MMISSDVVGMVLKEHRVKITWRQTTNFAAGIGDMNPRYVDDRRAEGIIAHPVFAAAISWPIVQNIDFITLPIPAEVFGTMVHYTECLKIFRPIRPGDFLTVRGRVAAVIPEKAGTHLVFEFAASDGSGQPVYTEYSGAMLRGVICDGSGKVIPEYPVMERKKEVKESLWETQVPISLEAPYIYDGCSNIVYPIHTSPRFAKEAGLPGVLLQGTATLALAVSRLIDREAGGEPARVRSIQARFGGMVFPGSEIVVRLTGREETAGQHHLSFQVFNQQYAVVISDGLLVID